MLDVKEAIGGEECLRGEMTGFYLLRPFFMLISIIWKRFSANLAKQNNMLAAICLVLPFGFFSPV